MAVEHARNVPCHGLEIDGCFLADEGPRQHHMVGSAASGDEGPRQHAAPNSGGMAWG
jgi:hypothetical protein